MIKRWIRQLWSADAPRPDPPVDPASRPPPTPAPAEVVEAHIARGNQALDAGNLADAARCYAEALAVQPSSVAARVNLAHACMEQDDLQAAAEHLRETLLRDPVNPDAFYMLGAIAKANSDWSRAVEHFEAAIAQKPDFELAYRDACQALFELGEHARAAEVASRGLGHHPQSAELWLFSGDLHMLRQDAGNALVCYQKALAIRPDAPEIHANLAFAQRQQGELREAAASYRRLLTLRPNEASLRVNLAATLHELGQRSDAIEQFRRAVQIEPGHVDAHINLGVLLQEDGQTELAIRSYRMALALDPSSASAHCNLGLSLAVQRDLPAAWACFEQALRLDPTHAPAHAAIGVQYNELGQPEKSAEALRASLRFDAGRPDMRSNLLFVLSFIADPVAYLEEAKLFGEAVTSRAEPFVHAAAAPTPDVLRIGFVSGDLRRHPVALFLEGVLAQLKHRRVELFAYSTRVAEDDVTVRLRPLFTGWRSIVGMHDKVAAQWIRDDGIHVLIDLAGHTAYNRLPVFAWKPAPVQASWMGYLASTGLPAMDYVLADRKSLPPEDCGQFTEKVWYLPDSLNCFTSPAEAPIVGDLPALSAGHVTFGSFQRMNKISDATLVAWSQVMQGVPGARLRLQGAQMAEPKSRERFLLRLQGFGIPSDRVTLVGPVPDRSQYLAGHQQVDIVLDTFPYPGITTTCEALWMGVPTVTVAGATLLSRQGASLLACVGLNDWVAADADDYVRIAIRHAADLPALARLRAGLRERASRSPLFDPVRFAGNLEAALRGMWAAAREPSEAPGG